MPTYTALTTLSGQGFAERLGGALEALDPAPTGVGVCEIEGGSGLWEVGGYFQSPPDEAALALLCAAMGAAPFCVSQLPQTDWVAHVRRELAPVTAGRFFVYGSHDAHRIPAGAQPLLIEAAMAFGTGHHGTTLGCLQAFDALLGKEVGPGCVADIGCGTAVLAMAAARVWDGPIIASDIDPVAVDVALANVAANDLKGRVQCVRAAGFDHSGLAGSAPFDLIFANILKGPLIALAPSLMSQLAAGGHAILSGLLNEQADDVIHHYRANGARVTDHLQIGEWSTLTLHKG